MTEKYYLNEGRLGDVITSIQVMATWPWGSLGKKSWEDQLGRPHSAEWRTIFNEHNEFFRLNEYGDSVALRWRRGLELSYDPVTQSELPSQELDKIEHEERKKRKLQPRPLESTEIQTLVNTAIELHGREIAQEQEKRWKTELFIPPLVGALAGSIIGVLLGELVKLL